MKSTASSASNGSHTQRILISCAGLGMGNASRISALIESLFLQAKLGGTELQVRVHCWGAGFEFLKEFQRTSDLPFELSELSAYALQGGLFGPARLIKIYFSNLKSLFKARRAFKPDLILLDSDYHFPAYFFAGSPVVFLGQTLDVLSRARSGSYRSSSLLETISFILRERADALLQMVFANFILCPVFATPEGQILTSKKVRYIPLISRREFTETPPAKADGAGVGVLLSGSGIEREVFLTNAEKHGLTTITPSGAESDSLFLRAPTLDKFEFVFTQGGLSSISEGIARGKFLVVFPIKNHPEQILNAIEVERSDLGIHASTNELDDFDKLVARAKLAREKAHPKAVECNGALIAAQFIASLLQRPLPR